MENSIEKVANQLSPQSQFMGVESTRAAKEVEASVAIAKRFPRDQTQSFNKLMTACKRRSLAEVSQFAYPRGNETVTGPTIRLAEAASNAWGNMQYGIRELSQSPGESVVEAYAWDMESNVRASKVFTIPHIRWTKKGGRQELTDPRDIYEIVANNGARRLRACILEVIPGDFIDAAIEECDKTLKSDSVPLPDRIRAMVVAFGELGVAQVMIEKRLNHKVESCNEAEVIGLKKIFRSLKEGIAKVEDFFEHIGAVSTEKTSAIVEGLKSQPMVDMAKMLNASTTEKEKEAAFMDAPEPTKARPREDIAKGILAAADMLGRSTAELEAQAKKLFKCTLEQATNEQLQRIENSLNSELRGK